MTLPRSSSMVVFGLLAALTAAGLHYVYARQADGLLPGLEIIWRDLLAMSGVGALFFAVALLRFRRAVTQAQG